MTQLKFGAVLIAAMTPVMLSGCTAQTALSNTLRAGTAIEGYAEEVVDRRKELRALRYAVQDDVIAGLRRQAYGAEIKGDLKAALEIRERLDAYIATIYPDIPALVSQIRNIRQSIRGDAEPGASEPSEKSGR